jgi:hypothetical protein
VSGVSVIQTIITLKPVPHLSVPSLFSSSVRADNHGFRRASTRNRFSVSGSWLVGVVAFTGDAKTRLTFVFRIGHLLV